MSSPPPDSSRSSILSVATDPEASDHAELDDIVRRAADLPADHRLAFLKSKCAGNNLLLAQALEKLKASSPKWWDMSMESRTIDGDDGLHERSGELIGPYRVIRSLGAGGMGEVLLAERDDRQFRQQVAIKLVRRGVLSPTVQARLKVERQILAALDHPNIARLLDGGADTDGTPYIVMEYIEGEPIDTYCDRLKLTVEARIALFRVVCSAVHCAHQNLVVHRDLKPSNILVSADGAPKLLDFGIAKVIDDRASMLHTMAVTQLDVRVMTPEHASPEQVRGDAITTVSDVYCLGVLLFELLSGARPYALTSHRLSEIERAICDDEPIPLNAVIADPEASLELCDLRSTTIPKLRRSLSGDLANIVMTAMRKEPERRYASVEQFSADLGRYVDGMPVAASKDSVGYRLRKFVTRHRVGVGFSALALIGIVTFAVVAVVQARLIAREKARAEYVSSFLVDMFENADPSRSRGKDITVREILDVGARTIDSSMASQPETRARLEATVGTVYRGLGLYDDGERLLQKALAERIKIFGPKHAETADAMERLGETLLSRNQFEQATPLLNDALGIFRREFGLRSLQAATTLRELGVALSQQEQVALGEQHLRESLSIFEELAKAPTQVTPAIYAETSETLNALGQLFERKGNYADAADMYRRSVAITAERLGRDHPSYAFNLHNLGVVLQKQGKLADARPIFKESLEALTRVFGAEHPETLAAMSNYGLFLHRLRDLDGAEKVYREVLLLDHKVRGDNDSFTGYDRVNLGLLLHDKAEYRAAETEFRSALEIYEKSLPANHIYKGSARRSLGVALIAMDRGREAEKELQTALRIFAASLPDKNPQILATRAALGKVYADQGRNTEAEPLLRDTYVALYKALGAEHPIVERQRAWTEEFYRGIHKPEAAQELFASLQSPGK